MCLSQKNVSNSLPEISSLQHYDCNTFSQHMNARPFRVQVFHSAVHYHNSFKVFSKETHLAQYFIADYGRRIKNKMDPFYMMYRNRLCACSQPPIWNLSQQQLFNITANVLGTGIYCMSFILKGSALKRHTSVHGLISVS